VINNNLKGQIKDERIRPNSSQLVNSFNRKDQTSDSVKKLILPLKMKN